MADMNGQLMEQIYSKLAAVLKPQPNLIVPGNGYLVLANPGTFLDPALDLKKADNQFLWASLLNRVPMANFIFQEAAQGVDAVYDAILDGKELPIVTLKPDQQKQLDAANALLYTSDGGATQKLLDYWTYQLTYDQANTDLQAAQEDAKNQGVPVPPNVMGAWRQAKQKFDTLGHRAEVERAIATINNLQDLDPNAFWEKLRNRYDISTSQNSKGASYEVTNTFPDYPTLFKGSGWTTVTFTQEDYESQQRSRSIDAGGGFSTNWGLWRASASASYKRDEGFRQSQSQSVNVAVDVMRVSIMRPWLNGIVLHSRAWRWGSGQSMLISNGADASQGQTPDGVMPLYPTSLILARNLKIKVDFGQDESSWFNQQIETNASVGWGPFAISGHYNQSDSSAQSRGTRAENTLSNPDVQILGMMCEVLGTCPNPDPQLPWAREMTLDHLPEYNVGRLRAASARRFKFEEMLEMAHA